MSIEKTVIEEHHIHGFLGYFTVAASILTIGSTLALLLGQYERAGRALSTRQGAHRRRLVQIFLGLALACFVVVTTLKYASPEARAEARETLAGGHAGSTANGHETRSTGDGYAANGDADTTEQRDNPMSMPGRFYIRVVRLTYLSEILNKQLPAVFGPTFDTAKVLAKWLPPCNDPAGYWWSSEYYWGAMIWFFFLSYETRLRALPWSTPVLLTLLSGYLSLAGSQCLLYALMLMSPIRDTNLERWTPYRVPLLVPFWVHAATWSLLPSTQAWAGTSVLTFATGALTYTVFTAITWIHPRRLGRYHASAASARRSQGLTLALMALPLVANRIYAVARTLVEAGSAQGTKVGLNLAHGRIEQAGEDIRKDVEYAAQSTFGLLADTGRPNAIAWDVVLSAVSLGLWTALAEADPMTMFRCTLLPWLKSEEEVAFERRENADKKSHGWLNTVKHLASVKSLTRFARSDEGPATGTAEAYVRKRGRPPKHRKSLSGNESGYAIARNKSKSRSPGRPRKSVSPSKRTSSRLRSQSRARSQARHRWKHVSLRGISIAGWEAAGATWCLVVVAGLGVSMLGAFGAEAKDFV